MSFTTAELEELLRLALAALRVQAGQQQPAQQPVAPAPFQPVASISTGRSLSEWLDLFDGLLTERNYKPQTLKNRRANVAHCRRLWGHVGIRELRPHQISAALQEFIPGRTSTAQRVLGEMRDIYTEAVHNDWAEHNPATSVRQVKHKVIRERLPFEVWLAMTELSQCSRQRWVECLLLLALVTGQRRADLAKMRFDDVVQDDAGRRYLRVEQQKEAGKGYGARLEIPLDLRLDAIGMTVGQVIERCMECAAPGTHMLRAKGGKRIEESSLSTRFHEHIVAALGEEAYQPKQWPSLHECRSLSARLYLEQGLEVKTIQTLLGHSDAEMTEIYLNDRGLTAKDWKRVAIADPMAQHFEAVT